MDGYSPRRHQTEPECPPHKDCEVKISDGATIIVTHRHCHSWWYGRGRKKYWCTDKNDSPWAYCPKHRAKRNSGKAKYRRDHPTYDKDTKARKKAKNKEIAAEHYSSISGRLQVKASNAKRSQRERGHDMDVFDPTEDRMVKMYDKQQGLCEYSGKHMDWNGAHWRPSIERFDPITTNGYKQDNYALVCLEFNANKRQWSPAKFKQLVHDLEQQYAAAYSPPVYSPPAAQAPAAAPNAAANASALASDESGITAEMDAWFEHILRGCTTSAAKRGHEMTLTPKDLADQLIKQDFKCDVSQHYMTYTAKTWWQCSVERVKEWLGYTADNIVMICYEFNTGNKTQWTSLKFNEMYPYLKQKYN